MYVSMQVCKYVCMYVWMHACSCLLQGTNRQTGECSMCSLIEKYFDTGRSQHSEHKILLQMLVPVHAKLLGVKFVLQPI